MIPLPVEDETVSSDSDYNVDEFVKAKRIRRTINDDSADLLGNFDDEKRKKILDGTYEQKSDTENNDTMVDSENEVSANEENSSGDENVNEDEDTASLIENADEINTNLSNDQLAALMRGTAKANRYVLYVTNLNFATQKGDLEEHFGCKGVVKSVRVPRKRRGGFAFVEMADLEGYQRAFQLHNSELNGRTIKVQFSEGGKKKSANKKNILKQKNRKLAEMRNEQKTFTKSGKFYDKTLKKEKAKELMARKRWRKPAGSRPPNV